MSPDNDKDELFSRYIARERNNLFSKMPLPPYIPPHPHPHPHPHPLPTTTADTNNAAAAATNWGAATATATATASSSSIFNLNNHTVSQAMVLNHQQHQHHQHQQRNRNTDLHPPDDRTSASSQASQASASMALYRSQQLVVLKEKELADLAILRRLRRQDEQEVRLRLRQQQQGRTRKEPSSLLLNNRDDAFKGTLMSMLSSSAPVPVPVSATALAPASAAEENLRTRRIVEGIYIEQEKEKILMRAANQQLVLQQQQKQQHHQQELMMLNNIRRRESMSAISDSNINHHEGDDNILLMNHIQNIAREQNSRMVLPAASAAAAAAATSTAMTNNRQVQYLNDISISKNTATLPPSSVSSVTAPASIFSPTYAASGNNTLTGGMTLADQQLLSLHHYYKTANASGVSGVSGVATNNTSSTAAAAAAAAAAFSTTTPNVMLKLTEVVDGFHHRAPAPAVYLPSSIIANANAKEITRRREREKQQRMNDLLSTTRAAKRFKITTAEREKAMAAVSAAVTASTNKSYHPHHHYHGGGGGGVAQQLVQQQQQQRQHQSGPRSPSPPQQQQRFNKHQCKQWTIKYDELLRFRADQGHCNVPHGYKQNVGLAMWVKRQRHQYNLLVEKKQSTLTGERIRLLESIGFVWSCLNSAWEKHFDELRQYSIMHGHCDVPSSYKENLKLASWVITQRRQCKLLEEGKSSSMTWARLMKLDGIGFTVAKRCLNKNRNNIES